MPNRIIKESICRSDSIDSLSWFEEVLFYRLIVVCDDYGRFDGRPSIIRGSCFPLKDIRLEHIENALSKLSTAGMVRRYEAGGRPYLQLISWERHQQIRAKRSKFPSPDETCNQLISDDCKCSRNPIQSESNPNRNRKENARATVSVRLFEEFLSVYPKGGNRYLTETAYVALVMGGTETEENLVSCAANYAESCRILGTPERYIKNAENFLREFAFEKYLPGNYKKPSRPKEKNGFNDFEQNKYDFEQLEKELTGG